MKVAEDWKFQGAGVMVLKTPWNGDSMGVRGSKPKNLLWEGYEYFLEPHDLH